MQAVLERKQNRHVQSRPAHAPAGSQCENWMFICDRCGQPICYDEPLQVSCHKGEMEVAHVECTRRQ
jgi:hypothetical protein